MLACKNAELALINAELAYDPADVAVAEAIVILLYIAVLAEPVRIVTLAVLKLPYVAVTLASVVFLLTVKLFPTSMEPLAIISSKPIESNIILPETVTLPSTCKSPPM